MPDHLAVLAPVATQRPARQRLAGVPLALAEMQQAAGSEPVFQPANQRARQSALFRAHRGEVPFCAVHVVDGNERRLPAHGEAHVVPVEFRVDPVAERFDFVPLFIGVRLGDPRRFEDARHPHFMGEFRFTVVHSAGDRRRARWLGCACQRNVAFAGEKAGRGIQSDPAGARQKHFAPGVEVSEIDGRPGRAIE